MSQLFVSKNITKTIYHRCANPHSSAVKTATPPPWCATPWLTGTQFNSVITPRVACAHTRTGSTLVKTGSACP